MAKVQIPKDWVLLELTTLLLLGLCTHLKPEMNPKSHSPYSTDLYSVVKAEFIALRLAELAGLNADVCL